MLSLGRMGQSLGRGSVVSGVFICLGEKESKSEDKLDGGMTEKGGKGNDDKKEPVCGKE